MTEKSFTGESITTPDSRVFKWLAFKPYTRKDGTDTELSIWQSACAICGEAFTVATPKDGTGKAFCRKHCDSHKLTKEAITALWSKAGNDAKSAKRGRHA